MRKQKLKGARERARMGRRAGLCAFASFWLFVLAGSASAGVVDSMWTRIYNGYQSGNYCDQEPARVHYDSVTHSIYIVGCGDGDWDPGQSDMLIMRYNLFGKLIWAHPSAGSYQNIDGDMGYQVCTDARGNVYLCGTTIQGATGQSIRVVRYDSAGNGNWADSGYIHTEWPGDEMVLDAVLSDSSLYLVGYRDTVLTGYHYSAFLVMCVDTARPTIRWCRTYALDATPSPRTHKPKRDFHPGFLEDDWYYLDNCATACARSSDGDLVVTGFGYDSNLDKEWWTMKFSPAGVPRWQVAYHDPQTTVDDDDVAFDVAIDPAGGIYCAGFAYYERGSRYSYDYEAVKYRPSDGVRLGYYQKDVSGVNGDDCAFSVVADAPYVYVTGFLEQNDPLYDDIYTCKLRSSDMTLVWETDKQDSGDSHGYDVIVNAGRVYVTGVRGMAGTGTSDDVQVLCYDTAYSATKDTLWSYVYRSPGNYDDVGSSIMVLDTNNVYVTGQTERSTMFGLRNSIYTTRLVNAHPDVAVMWFVAPHDTIPVGTLVDTPCVWVKNQGNLLPTFWTYLRIGAFYYDSALTQTLLPDDSALVKFKSWTALPLGEVAMRCSANILPDTNVANNVLEETVYVAQIDAACLSISAPTGSIDSGVAVVPQAWIKNMGTMTHTFGARFLIGASYADTQTVTIGPGDSVLQGFDPWLPVVRGSYALLCSTMLRNDQDTANDRQTGSVTVRVRDVMLRSILAPVDTIDSGDVVRPWVWISNRGTEEATFKAFFLMEYGTDTVGYLDSVSITLAAMDDTLVLFAQSGKLNRPGLWYITTWSGLADQHPENDTLRKTLLVVPPGGFWPVGWVEVTSVPIGLSSKAVKGGGSVTAMASTGRIYATKGNKTAEFYEYEPAAKRWVTRTPIPPGVEAKLVYNGCDLCADGNGHVYATKGNNTLGFWKYTVADSGWTRLRDVPLGLSGKKVKAGTGLAWVETGGLEYVYMLKGYKNEFYRYKVQTDTWEVRTPAPVGMSTKYDKGSFIVHDGASTIYAHKAKYNELWRYDVTKDSWGKQLTGMPLYGSTGRKKKSKDGGSGAWFDGMIYALKGGNTCEFWRYTAATDSWKELDTMPAFGSTGRRKKVKDGGDICYYARAFWALKGNKTREFWRYGLPLTAEPKPEPSLREGVAGTSLMGLKSAFEVIPNPMTGNGFLRYSLPAAANVSVRAYTVDGRLVATLLSGHLAQGTGMARLKTDHLAAGVYLLRLDTGPAAVTRSFKLVVR